MKNVAAYIRVSTTRQAEHDISLPDQLRKIEAYTEAKGWLVAEVFEERGASGTKENRPELQRMLAKACGPDRPFDVILVYNLSRLARDAAFAAIVERKLAKKRVEIVSIMEDYGNDANGRLIKGVLNNVYEHQSAFNAAITSSAMQANAREGFWNGSQPPFGFRTYVAETRGTKEKKKLERNPGEAEIVELIFQLYTQGDGDRGPLGIKNVVNALSAKGLRNRRGKPFSVQFTGKILRNEAYIGKCWFNRIHGKTRFERPREEWIEVPVPALIEEHIFATAQERLDAHHPLKLAPRLANSSVLLTGLAVCQKCGGRMKVRTSKGNRYRYYVCARACDEGKARCDGVRIPRDDLDTIVLDNFCDQVLAPERVSEIASSLLARAAGKNQALKDSIRALEREQREVGKKLDNLYSAISDGVELDGSLKAKIASLQDRREQLIRLQTIKRNRLDAPLSRIPATKAEDFSNAIRARLLDRSKPEFARAYLRMMISSVEVGPSEIRISCPKEALVRQAAAFIPHKDPVLTFEQGWGAVGDSNPGPAD